MTISKTWIEKLEQTHPYEWVPVTEKEYKEFKANIPTVTAWCGSTPPLSGLKANDYQIGGEHYSKNAIQPIEYINANNLSYFEGNVVKYITRHKFKNKEEDIKKAMHYCAMILEYVYGVK